jgi:dihydrofolate reductase
VNAIVSVTRDWGIGSEGRLLVRNKVDMHRFVELTMGGCVLMGRKTFESFPGGALKGRRNVVLTRDAGFGAPGVEVVHGVEEALRAVSGEAGEKVWLIGGESVYRELLPACERAYVTKNDVVRPADAFFPDLDADPSWVIAEEADGGVTTGGVPFSFVTYQHVRP